jgi:hypothetical protein
LGTWAIIYLSPNDCQIVIGKPHLIGNLGGVRESFGLFEGVLNSPLSVAPGTRNQNVL